MGDKVYLLVISVDLGCCRCRQAIQDCLCQMQLKERIVAIVYDEKNSVVLVSGPFNPEQLKRKLLCKLPKIIKSIDIRPPKGNTKPPVQKPPTDENCLEECKEISKCIEKCKKECEEKCRTECENKFKCKCKRKCKCDCDCDCEKKKPPKPPMCPSPPLVICCEEKCRTECENKFKCKCKRKCKCDCDCDCEKKKPPTPPMCPSPPLVICCARPCPCLTAWSNNYRCCSCGVESWPEMRGLGSGGGPSHGGHPQWSNYESSQQSTIVFQSAEACSIM
ncbi:hypothetical protein FCM35_KLT22391 [Carex littledalei]|uniref:Uncharacterized protein n=1 Tax=Carex littledalei TaxID=544730 RepID=A0A833V1Q7_9POAL|nr:hypothetical protein FCM35_KLT22391 [Carex littledalei]